MARTDRSAVAKALDLLTALADADRPLRLSEVAGRVRLHRATAYRSLDELLKRGFVIRDNEDRYLLGPAFLRMTESPATRHAFAELAYPVLAMLATDLERIASIAVLEQGGCRLVGGVRPARYQQYLGYGGQVLEPWRPAGGMVLLAYSGSAQTAPFLDAAATAGLDTDKLAVELEHIRRHGFAHYVGRLDPLITQVAVPVRGAAGACRAAITASGFIQDFDDEMVSTALEKLTIAATEIEKLLNEPVAQETHT